MDCKKLLESRRIVRLIEILVLSILFHAGNLDREGAPCEACYITFITTIVILVRDLTGILIRILALLKY